MGYKQGENQRPVGAVRRDRWEYFMDSLGMRGSVPKNHRELYRLSIGGQTVRLQAEFGTSVVYVSADSKRGDIRQRVRDANSNSVK